MPPRDHAEFIYSKGSNMNDYGKAAIEAVKLYTNKESTSPWDARSEATARIFGPGTSSQKKGCPRDTFLGLCQTGQIKGIPSGSYTRSKKNKQYSLDAVAILKRNPALATNPIALWKQVLQGDSKVHNHQMNLVISLWSKELLV